MSFHNPLSITHNRKWRLLLKRRWEYELLSRCVDHVDGYWFSFYFCCGSPSVELIIWPFFNLFWCDCNWHLIEITLYLLLKQKYSHIADIFIINFGFGQCLKQAWIATQIASTNASKTTMHAGYAMIRLTSPPQQIRSQMSCAPSLSNAFNSPNAFKILIRWPILLTPISLGNSSII